MPTERSTSWVGTRVPRLEDRPLITGQGRYVSDIHFDGELTAVFVRSTHAHARIRNVDLSRAKTMPGVQAIYTGRSLPALARELPDGHRISPRGLTPDEVFYVGEPLAVILADSRYTGEDAAEAVHVEYEPLPVVAHIDDAVNGPTVLHPTVAQNLYDPIHYEKGDGSRALQQADVVIEERLEIGRVSAQPMEPRGVVAHWDANQQTLTVYHSTQSVHRAQERIAQFVGLPLHQVRVIAPDVGGGFGVKNGAYPEEAVVSYLAYLLQRPIRWIGDRFEEFLSTYQEREQIHDVQLGVTHTGEIVALVDTFYQDNGAYPAGGPLVTNTTARNLIGPYRIPHFAIDGHTVLTNKVPQAPYRGAGRPQGHYVIERMLDRAADKLGIDRAEIRLRNLLTPADLPYDTGLPQVVYDSGDYRGGFEKLLAFLNYPALRETAADGQRIGIGLANYVEISGGFAFEGARIRLTTAGRIEILTGAATQGQGHRTALAQIAADRLQVPLESIRVIEGDTGEIAKGIGTFGSRTMIFAGNATRIATDDFIQQAKKAVAEKLEAHAADIHLGPQGFFVGGVPGLTVSWTELATWLVSRQKPLPEAEHYFSSNTPTFGYGAHALVVQVDPATYQVSIRQYVILHDGGVIINPLLTDGQVIGAAVQGLGSALWEEMIYGDDGQPLTTTFLDYHLPGAVESPDITILHENYPAPSNPLGFKGVGEAGIIPSQTLVLSAVEDAFRDLGLALNRAPVTPRRLFEAVSRAQEVMS